jgi:G:T-mismatch repair DNA endonuclease (very short patch repair protein)
MRFSLQSFSGASGSLFLWMAASGMAAQSRSMLRCPKNAPSWWAAKLARNKARDREVNRALRHAGWRVLRVWECDLTRANAPRVVRRVLSALSLPTG